MMKTVLTKTSFNKEKTMKKVKKVWALAQAHPEISIAVVVVIVAVYFIAN